MTQDRRVLSTTARGVRRFLRAACSASRPDHSKILLQCLQQATADNRNRLNGRVIKIAEITLSYLHVALNIQDKEVPDYWLNARKLNVQICAKKQPSYIA